MAGASPGGGADLVEVGEVGEAAVLDVVLARACAVSGSSLGRVRASGGVPGSCYPSPAARLRRRKLTEVVISVGLRSKVVGDHVHHHPNVARMAGLDQRLQVFGRAKLLVDAVQIFRPVPVVSIRGVLDHRRDPNCVEAHPLDVVQVILEAGNPNVRTGHHTVGAQGGRTNDTWMPFHVPPQYFMSLVLHSGAEIWTASPTPLVCEPPRRQHSTIYTAVPRLQHERSLVLPCLSGGGGERLLSSVGYVLSRAVGSRCAYQNTACANSHTFPAIVLCVQRFASHVTPQTASGRGPLVFKMPTRGTGKWQMRSQHDLTVARGHLRLKSHVATS
eukprot:2275605-Rhodomonas_salina.2